MWNTPIGPDQLTDNPWWTETERERREKREREGEREREREGEGEGEREREREREVEKRLSDKAALCVIRGELPPVCFLTPVA